MPSHTLASTLVKLHELGGAPWQWPTWQDITGIHHGLFPEDDCDLPPGWTRKNAIDVKSYFVAYRQQKTEEQKIAFAVNVKHASKYPGREYWNSWVNRHRNSWGIHTFVVEALREHDVHPLTILAEERPSGNTWPDALCYIPVAIDTLAANIFGSNAFPDGSARTGLELRKCLMMITQTSWNTIRAQVTAKRNRRDEIEAVAKAAFKGKPMFTLSFAVLTGDHSAGR